MQEPDHSNSTRQDVHKIGVIQIPSGKNTTWILQIMQIEGKCAPNDLDHQTGIYLICPMVIYVICPMMKYLIC